MQSVRYANDRGAANHGWLDAKHSFSFGQYYDPAHMAFRSLRVMNEDRIAAGAGFPKHPHQDMEILTYLIEGALAHKDSTGGGGVIRPGEVQYMSAGSGVVHSEFNGSSEAPAHIYQIWIMPNVNGAMPRYDQKDFAESRSNALTLVASQDGRDGSFEIRQDAEFYIGKLDEGLELSHETKPSRGVWVQAATGSLIVNGADLKTGDGVAIENVEKIDIKSTATGAEVLLFDLA